MKPYELIVESMGVSLIPELRRRLDRIHELCSKATDGGGSLNSRQVVAQVIMDYEREEQIQGWKFANESTQLPETD